MIREWIQRRRKRLEVKVAAVFLGDPDGYQFGYPLSRTAEVRPSALYPVLDRFEDRGWIRSGWTDSMEPRRYYVITKKGLREMPH